VNFVKFLNPAATFPVFERHQLFERPMKMISEAGYLLAKLREGVAYDFPSPSGSTSNPFSQCGQTIFNTDVPFPLILL
jgi:hypothetical protein